MSEKNLCPHLTGDHKTIVYLGLMITSVLLSLIGGCTYADFREKKEFRDNGYCQTLLPGKSELVWRKCQ